MIHFRFIRFQRNRKFWFTFAVKRFCKNQCIVETQYYPKEIKIQLINLNTRINKKIKLKSALPTDQVISKEHLDAAMNRVKVDIIDFVNALKNKNIIYTSSFMDNIMSLLDTHELNRKHEEMLRDIIAVVMEGKEKKNG